jgi:hypothetical protein
MVHPTPQFCKDWLSLWSAYLWVAIPGKAVLLDDSDHETGLWNTKHPASLTAIARALILVLRSEFPRTLRFPNHVPHQFENGITEVLLAEGSDGRIYPK